MPITVLDLVEDDEAIERASSRTAETPDPALVAAVKSTFDRTKSNSLYVTKDEEGKAKGLLRKAADMHGLGVRIDVSDAPSKKGEPAKVRIRFQGVEKRAYNERTPWENLPADKQAVSNKGTAARLAKMDAEKRAKTLGKMSAERQAAVLAILNK